MRTTLGVLMLTGLCLPFFQCGGGDDSTGAQASDGGANDSSTSDSAPTGDSSTTTDSSTEVIDVNGSLVGGTGPNGAIVNRDVNVIDANDVVTKVTTDAAGKFVAHGVQTPYDIAVPFDPPDAASPGIGQYYAGISAPNPIVSGSDYNAYTTPPQQQSTVTFTADACASCLIFFSSPDYNVRFAGTGAAAPYSVNYTWSGSATHSAPMHVYVTDNTVVYQSYVDLPAQALNAGGTTALGTLTLAPVTNGNVSITVNLPASSVLDDFNVVVSHADGSNQLGYSGALTNSPGVGNYPRLPNMVLTAAASSYVGSADSQAKVVYSEAAIPGSITMSMIVAPTLLTPASAATGVTDADSLSWSPFGTPTVTVLQLVDSGGKYTELRTTASSFVLGRLTKAGMGLKATTGYQWLVQSGGQADTMDHFVTHTATPQGTITYEGQSLTQKFTTQ